MKLSDTIGLVLKSKDENRVLSVGPEQSVYEDAEAAMKWVDTRVPDRRKRVLYGHSLGGPIAAEAALRSGGAAALVLESTFTSVSEMTHLSGLVTQRFDLLDKVQRLRLPVLIVHGTADGIFPVTVARENVDKYRREGHEVSYIEVPGLGHAWASDANINERIWAFFAAHPRRD